MRRDFLPQMGDRVVLTDSGLETTLLFHDGFDLPEFASFPLLDTTDGRGALERYFRTHIDVANAHLADIVLETPTWRSNSAWGEALGYAPAQLRALNIEAVQFVRDIADDVDVDDRHVVVSGNIGPLSDGYSPGEQVSADAAQQAHAPQVEAFADAGADMVCALTLTYAAEATGVARAAAAADIPVAIHFTVETDGRLPTGATLGEAIDEVDSDTDGGVAYFGINCAHPTHFRDAVATDEPWIERIRACRANASRMSHAELDEAEELDAGDPVELGQQFADLRTVLPELRVVGGCCGTDHRHIDAIAAVVV